MRASYLALASLLLAGAGSAYACSCDQCSLYLGRGPTTGNLRTGIFAQYADLETKITGSTEHDNLGERVQSLNVQAFLEYRMRERLTLQVNVPYLNRDYRQLQEGALQDGSESGLGDISLLARYAVLAGRTEASSWRVELLGGVKLPTGDTDRLREEESPDHAGDGHAAEAVHSRLARHAGEEHPGDGGEDAAGHAEAGHDESVIHEHNLALGSGSIDGLLGVAARGERGGWYSRGQAQYWLRTEGDHDYRYGDDLMVSAAAGRMLLQGGGSKLGAGLHALYETRGADEQAGAAIPNTDVTAWYAGAHADWTSGALDGELAVDLPVQQESAGTSLVPDYRIRASVGLVF